MWLKINQFYSDCSVDENTYYLRFSKMVEIDVSDEDNYWFVGVWTEQHRHRIAYFKEKNEAERLAEKITKVCLADIPTAATLLPNPVLTIEQIEQMNFD